MNKIQTRITEQQISIRITFEKSPSGLKKANKILEFIKNLEDKLKSAEVLDLSVQRSQSEGGALLTIHPSLLTRVKNVMNNHNIETVRELAKLKKWQLLKFRNLGRGGVALIVNSLNSIGIPRLGMSDQELDALFFTKE